MAYLSDLDNDEQQQQSQAQNNQGQGFNIYLPASSLQSGGATQDQSQTQGQSPQSPQTQSQGLGQPNLQNTAGDLANQAASNYAQSTGDSAGANTAIDRQWIGGGNPTASTSSPTVAPSVLGGSDNSGGNVSAGQQNGYINFSDYQNANASMAPQVTQYGTKQLNAGQQNYNQAQSTFDADSGGNNFSTPLPDGAPSIGNIASQIQSGTLTPAQIAQIQGYGTEAYTGATGSTYQPTDSFEGALGAFGVDDGTGQTNYGAPQSGTLVQELYGNQNPQLQAEVTPGTTALDTALLQSDKNVQNTVGNLGSQLGLLNTKANQQSLNDAYLGEDYQNEAQAVQSNYQGALTQIQNQLANDALTDDASGTMAQDLAAYEAWFPTAAANPENWTVVSPGAVGSGLNPNDQTTANNLASITGIAQTYGSPGIAPTVTNNANPADVAGYTGWNWSASPGAATGTNVEGGATTNLTPAQAQAQAQMVAEGFTAEIKSLQSQPQTPAIVAEIAALQSQVTQAEAAAAPVQTPYAYGIALGYTPAQLQAMGLSP